MNRIWRVTLVIFIILMLCVSFLPISVPVYAATTYYVSTTGDNGNLGTIGSPWGTIQYAVNNISAGDTILVRAGTYYETVYWTNDGTAESHKTLSNYPTESVTIDATGLTPFNTTDGSGILSLSGANYWDVSGFELVNGDYTGGSHGIAGIAVAYATNNTFTDMEIHACNWSGITTSGGNNHTFTNCEVYNCNHLGWDESISIQGTDYVEISGGSVHDSDGADHYTHNKEGIDVKWGSTNVQIHGVEIYNTFVGIQVNANNEDPVTDIDIYDNYIHDNNASPDGGQGICVEYESDEAGFILSDVNIYNNIIANNATIEIDIGYVEGSENPSFENIYVYNNTIYNNTTKAIHWWGGSYNQANGRHYDNCIVANNIIDTQRKNSSHASISTDGVSIPDADLHITNNLIYTNAYENASGNYGSNYILDNPDFATAGSDYTLQVTSPAIDEGSATYAPSTDYAGTSRPLGDADDIGAYEYNSIAAPTNVSATDGTHTDKVTITWTKSDFATGYKIYRNGTLIDTVGDVATYDDTDASAPTITVGTSSASDGTNTSYCTLGVSGEVSNNGTSYSYTVKATNADGDSAASSANTGYRGSGLLLYQWQRSDTGASYANLGSGTTDPYNDTTGTAGTTYYYRCKLSASDATDGYSSADTGYKAITETSATVTTGSVTSILTTSATVAGNITGTGTSNVTQRGVCYSTTINPTTSDSKVNEASSSFGTGAFSEHLTGLVASTLYHVRAYATNSNGTSYGGDVSFTTTALTPTPTPTPTTTPNPLPTLAPYTNSTAFTDAVVGINGIIILVFMFVAVFGIILLISKGENIIIALVAAVVIIYLMVSFLPGLNTLIGGMFGLG